MVDELNPHSQYSSRREKLLESLFSGEVLRELWQREIYDVDLLHSDIDASGYDLVLDVPEGVRHIQLKASTKAKQVTANAKICDRPSGCVIVMIVNENTLEFEQFLWFGNALNVPCGDIRSFPRAKHNKGDSTGYKSQRVNTHKLSVGKFERIPNFKALVDKLVLRKFV